MGTFDIQISPDEPVYVISVVSKLVGIPVWTLRQLDKAGIVCPKRIGKKAAFIPTRIYENSNISII